MTPFWRAALFSFAFLPSAAHACQPPPDMPVDERARELYWKRMERSTQQLLVGKATVLIVGQASVISTNPTGDTSMVQVTPIKLLRGSAPGSAGVRVQSRMCQNVNTKVYSGRIYLFALDGRDVLLAEPLIPGQERAGVRALMTAIGTPQLWN